MGLIKDLKPNIAFLNPPYKEGNSEKQLEFIENACDLLETNGTCVAIVQFSCAISRQKNVLLVKERLLKKHKLKAVFSMPDELFTPVGVVTCIIVLQSHTPHDKNSKTFFGYFKDDGFVKTKKGRIDKNNQWHEIEKHWLKIYKNNEEQDGLSVKKEVTFEDEWCAEAYMVTDYSKLTKEDFINMVHNFVTYKFASKLLSNASNDSVAKSTISLNQNEWEYFKLQELFLLKMCGYPKIPETEGKIPLITATEFNNGVHSYIDAEKNKIFKGGKYLTIAKNGKPMVTFYQPSDFSYNIHVLPIKLKNFELNQYIAMFLVTILNNEQYRFSYGRAASQISLKTLKIKLPIDANSLPDWKFMEDYIKSLPYTASL